MPFEMSYARRLHFVVSFRQYNVSIIAFMDSEMRLRKLHILQWELEIRFQLQRLNDITTLCIEWKKYHLILFLLLPEFPSLHRRASKILQGGAFHIQDGVATFSHITSLQIMYMYIPANPCLLLSQVRLAYIYDWCYQATTVLINFEVEWSM